MKQYLSDLDINIEIWYFEPSAKDDLFEDFKEKFINLDPEQIKQDSGIGMSTIIKIKAAFEQPNINSISNLLSVKGIGKTTVEKSFKYINNLENTPKSLNLF